MRAMDQEHGGTSEGLHAPGAALGSLETPRRWSPARVALQSAGALLAFGLLVWALTLALSEKNQASLDQLRQADAWRVAQVIGLSAVSVGLSGLLFWVVARPERRVPLASASAANAIAMGLGLVPFKMGMVARVLIHHRRDGMAFKDIVGWVAAIAALSVVTLVPLALAGVWRRDLDALWWIVGVGGVCLGHGIGIVVGRAAASRPVLARVSLGSWRFVRHGSGVWSHGVIRLVDLALLGVRFWLVASMSGLALSMGDAMLFGVVYITLVVGSPFGRIGFAEMAVAGVATALGHDAEHLALVAITVTAAEAITSICLAAVSFVYIRPDRLMARRSTSRVA